MTGRKKPHVAAAPEAPEEATPEAPEVAIAEPATETQEESAGAVVRVIVPDEAPEQRFSGFGVRLKPGANLVNANKLLMYLLKRGEARGRWKLEAV